MKNKELNYIKAPALTELAGVPLFTYRAIKRLINKETISDSLDKIIFKSKKNATELKDVSNAQLKDYRDEYEKADNFFSKHFSKYKDLNVDDRIEYCLIKFKDEIKKINTSSNSIVLEENFLKGAERTLMLYFFLKERKSIEEVKLPISIDNRTYNNTNYYVINNTEFSVINNTNSYVINNTNSYVINNINFSVINNIKNTSTFFNDNRVVDNSENLKDNSQQEQEPPLSSITLQSSFTDSKHYDLFIEMIDLPPFELRDEKTKTPKKIVATILNKLRIMTIVKEHKNKILRRGVENSLDIKMSKSYFSEGINMPITSDYEKVIDKVFKK